MIQKCLLIFGRLLARYLNSPSSRYIAATTTSLDDLRRTLLPGDVMLVEGNLRVSTAIKFLTQSTWSHSAIYVGPMLGKVNSAEEVRDLIEADLEHGVVAVPISKYANFNIRICRPIGLTPDDCAKVVKYSIAKLNNTYDLKNVIDLVRYLLPTPPVPITWRRQLLVFGSGDPTKAICSTLIAQAFQSIKYPILPIVEKAGAPIEKKKPLKEIFKARHYSLFTPRDFDISPYFQIIKPSIVCGFKYKDLTWKDTPSP